MDDRVDALITSTPPASSHRVGRARRVASHRFARQVRIVATRESRTPIARPPVALPPASRSHRARRLAASRAPLRDYLPLKRHARDAFVPSSVVVANSRPRFRARGDANDRLTRPTVVVANPTQANERAERDLDCCLIGFRIGR